MVDCRKKINRGKAVCGRNIKRVGRTVKTEFTQSHRVGLAIIVILLFVFPILLFTGAMAEAIRIIASLVG